MAARPITPNGLAQALRCMAHYRDELDALTRARASNQVTELEAQRRILSLVQTYRGD